MTRDEREYIYSAKDINTEKLRLRWTEQRDDYFDLHPKKVTHKKSTGAKKVTFLEEKNGKRKCTSRSKNQSNN